MAHDVYLVFIVEQNLVGIDAVVLGVALFSYYLEIHMRCHKACYTET